MRVALKLFLIVCLVFCLFKGFQSAENAKHEKRILMDDNNYYTVLAKLDAMEKDVTALKAHNEALEKKIATLEPLNGSLVALENEVKTLQTQNDALRTMITALETENARSHTNVAFLAELTTTITGTGHHIYFDNVKLNQGNAYNPHHGTFVPPVNGTYMISLTACSEGRHFIVLQVNVNNQVLGRIIAGTGSFGACSSKVMIAHLQAGDDVFVQHLDYGDYLLANSNYGYPLFAGILLHAD